MSAATIDPGKSADPRESYAYERCMDQAAARAKPQPKAQPPSYDKDGKLVNSGDPPKVTATSYDGATYTPNNCRAPSGQSPSANRGVSFTSGAGAERYLVFLASEIPVKATDLIAMKFNEGDMNSVVFSLAKKLYGTAPWSGYFLRW